MKQFAGKKKHFSDLLFTINVIDLFNEDLLI